MTKLCEIKNSEISEIEKLKRELSSCGNCQEAINVLQGHKSVSAFVLRGNVLMQVAQDDNFRWNPEKSPCGVPYNLPATWQIAQEVAQILWEEEMNDAEVDFAECAECDLGI